MVELNGPIFWETEWIRQVNRIESIRIANWSALSANPWATCTENMMTFERFIPAICSQTDRPTNRQAHHNRGGVYYGIWGDHQKSGLPYPPDRIFRLSRPRLEDTRTLK